MSGGGKGDVKKEKSFSVPLCLNSGSSLQETQSSVVILVAMGAGVKEPRSVMMKGVHRWEEASITPSGGAQVSLLGGLRWWDDIVPGDHGLIVR